MSKIRNISSHEPFKLCTLLKAGFAFLILFELLGPFFANAYGPDGGFHLYWIQQFIKLNAEGIIFPRWIPDGYSGFGSPSFYFYPPLTYYLASLVHTVSGLTTPAALFQTINLLATIASFFTIRLLLKSMGAVAPQLWIGSALYAFAPYRIAEIYSLSSLSSHVAFVFLPLVWCGIIEMFGSNNPARRGMLLFATSFAGLTLCNIPVTALTIVTMILAAILFRDRLSWKRIAALSVGFGIAALLVSFYLAPVLEYMPYIQLNYLSAQREFFLDDLLRVRNLPGLYHLALLYGAIAAVIVAYMHIHRKKERISLEERALLRIGTAVTILILILEIPVIGRPVLRSFPLIDLVQGTWRFYIDIVLLASCIVSVATSELLRRAAKQIVWFWIAGAMLSMGFILFHAHLSSHQETRVSDPPEYVPIYAPKNHDTLESVLSQYAAMSATVSTSNNGDNTITLQTRSPDREIYAVNCNRNSTVTFHRFYWPAWHLYVKDREIISYSDSIGRATAILPAGRYIATWQLERSPLERAGLWISGFTAIGILLAGAAGYVFRTIRIGEK